MTSQELEKTYLAKYLPKDIENSPRKEIIDIYFPVEMEHPTMRLRKNGNKYELTKKTLIDETDFSRQIEQTIPLTEEEFSVLAALPSKKIHKIRYYLPYYERTSEIDVFQGDLAGLVLVDFEFETDTELDAFEMPDFCLADVTQEMFIAGKNLCGKRYADIESDLSRFSYSEQFPA